MEKNKELEQSQEDLKRIKEIKEKFGDEEAFLSAFSIEKQILVPNIDKVFEDKLEAPTIKEVCLAYGKFVGLRFVLIHLFDFEVFAGRGCLTDEQKNELCSIIVNEFKDYKVTAIMCFFYGLKCGRYVTLSDMINPLVIVSCLRQFKYEYYFNYYYSQSLKFINKKVFLIVEDQPRTKVYARVFASKESAENALQERDERTGEKRYPACHVIERTIE